MSHEIKGKEQNVETVCCYFASVEESVYFYFFIRLHYPDNQLSSLLQAFIGSFDSPIDTHESISTT